MSTRHPENLVRLLERQAQARPGAAALLDGGRSWTFAALDAEVGRFAGALSAAGLAPGERLGVCLRDTADHLIARLAAARAGVALVPMDWRTPPAERARVAADFRVAAVLTEPGAAVEATHCIALDGDWAARVAASVAPPPVDDADLPFVLSLSSGTTGAPKAAVVTHGNYLARIANNAAAWGSLAGHRYFSASPLYFSAGSHFCLTTLLQGGMVFLYPPIFGAEEYVAQVAAVDATMAFLVPTVLRWLLAQPHTGRPLLPSLRVLIASAAPLTADEKRAIAQRISPNLIEVYGSAAGGQIAVLLPDDMAERAGSVGRPLGDLEVEVVDGQSQRLPAGEVGHVRVRGPGVAQCWFETGNGTAHAERMVDGWNFTGDLASFDRDGYLWLHGRADDVILRGGANIYPDVVEAALRRHPAVADAAVVGRPVAGDDPQVLAFVILRVPVAVPELLAHCRGVLPAWMLPAEVRVVEALPRTTSGKVRRRDLLGG
jgi:acyl-CoA synthetase (AMP-forming)/AMP-acid ligase II